ncbi:MAG: AAA-like domain-containing protein [Bacteroidota bacterium]
MEKFFNTAGPISNDLHYYVDSKKRWNFRRVTTLIAQQKYFVLHAPRQTGKTSALLALVDYLNATGKYEAVYANIETAQSARENVPSAMKAIVGSIASSHRLFTKSNLLEDNWLSIYNEVDANNAILALLRFWAENTAKPTVLFLDEVDALIGDTLISLLRQIRAGYNNRPTAFPISIVLCGVRDMRDYRIHSSRTKEIITGGSAFNIKAESLRLENFTKDHIQDLYGQHTAATGQVFEQGVIDLVWYYTEGQPWLVNALAYEATFNMSENTDRSKVITKDTIQTAKERLILRRDTHLDQLVDKLKEPRVQRVIEPMLSGKVASADHRPDDVQYVRDLGLINVAINGQIDIANAIYKEVIPRELIWTMQTGMTTNHLWYIQPNGSLDIFKLLESFQDFFRKHSEHWVEMYHYKEAAPQLLLQAYLQRIVNGGGRIEREYGFGRGRTDLFVEYFYGDGQKQEIVIELKILYNSIESTIEEGLQQIKNYMDKCGTQHGHLLIFDRRTNRSWEEKIWYKEVEGIHIWGC